MARGRTQSPFQDAEVAPQEAPPRLTCDCGALLVNGLCRTSGGYPATSACPFSCPICRQPLAWSGACERCHGCRTGDREDWAFPGQRYELEKGHWQRAETVTERAACTPEENLAGLAEVRAALARSSLSLTRRLEIPDVHPEIRRDIRAGLVPQPVSA